ncbi:MAG TPA: phosphoribosyltransferase [Thermoanaerobaculia bacterium]
MLFRDRRDAGRLLAEKLTEYAHRRDVVVLALPRGGVPVAYEVARALEAPLDVFLVRKLGLPGHEELAIGAIATGGVQVLNENVLDRFHVPERIVSTIVAREDAELQRREQAYRGGRAPHPVRGKTVILIDDGLATGSSMRAAVIALRQRGPSRIVVGVPVAPPETCREFQEVVDKIVCATTPQPFYAVGQWYEDFAQTTDEEVRELLALAREEDRGRGEPGAKRGAAAAEAK